MDLLCGNVSAALLLEAVQHVVYGHYSNVGVDVLVVDEVRA